MIDPQENLLNPRNGLGRAGLPHTTTDQPSKLTEHRYEPILLNPEAHSSQRCIVLSLSSTPADAPYEVVVGSRARVWMRSAGVAR